MEAMVLAGGFGSRLRDIVSTVPKPMAPINRKPFLKYLLDYLINNGVEHIILAVGYKAEIIQRYFGGSYNGTKVSYSIENIPLGTGGAIKNALDCSSDEDIFIVNGDTFFDVKLEKMRAFHYEQGSSLTVAVKPMENFDRYGNVIIEENHLVKKFEEKKPTKLGMINGGMYLINRAIINSFNEDLFSFEKTILESNLFDIYAFESDGYFLDIGIPEDYHKAQKDFLHLEVGGQK